VVHFSYVRSLSITFEFPNLDVEFLLFLFKNELADLSIEKLELSFSFQETTDESLELNNHLLVLSIPHECNSTRVEVVDADNGRIYFLVFVHLY
jgi:hypothetical protein